MFRRPRDWPAWAQAAAVFLLIVALMAALVLFTRAAQEPDLDQTPSPSEQVGPVRVVVPPPAPVTPSAPTAQADIPAPPPKPPTTTPRATAQPVKKAPAPAKPAGCDWMREYTKATLAAPGPHWEIGPLAADEGGMYYPSSGRARIHRIVDCADVRAIVFHEWGHYQQHQVYGSIEKAHEQLAPFGGIERVADCVAKVRGANSLGDCVGGKAELAAQAMVRGVLAPNTER